MALSYLLIASPWIILLAWLGLLAWLFWGKDPLKRAVFFSLVSSFAILALTYSSIVAQLVKRLPSEGFDVIFDPLTGAIVYWLKFYLPVGVIVFSVTWLGLAAYLTFKTKLKTRSDYFRFSAWGFIFGVLLATGVTGIIIRDSIPEVAKASLQAYELLMNPSSN